MITAAEWATLPTTDVATPDLVPGDVVYFADAALVRVRAIDKLPDGTYALWGAPALHIAGHFTVRSFGTFAATDTFSKVQV